jgi:hypothetical protein
MAITLADVSVRYSVPSATEGDADAQPNPRASLGKHVSTTVCPSDQLHNLFGPVTRDEAMASGNRYLCLFVVNTHATLTWQGVKVWLASQLAGGAIIAIGLDPVGVVDVDDTDDQAATAASITTAPTGVTFSRPRTEAVALSVGDVGPGQCFAVWLRQQWVADPAAKNEDWARLRVTGTTEA